MKIAIIINKERITPDLTEKLDSGELSVKYNIDYDVFIKPPQEIEPLLQSMNPKTYNAYLVGGGDGTVRSVVKYLAEHSIPLAILPLGTFNLLAHSLEHSNDIDAMFAMIKNNKTKNIDVAEVNGHTIINHAWLGVYYYVLKARVNYKNLLGNNRFFKAIFNTCALFWHFPIFVMEIAVDGKIIAYKSCLIFIGNNESNAGFFNYGEHKYLSTGLLSIKIANCKNRFEFFLFIWHMVFSKGKHEKYISDFTTDNMTLTLPHKKTVNMVIDGELASAENPLKFSMFSKKLMVVHP
jgi:diacylglycerol kinase family enzyme